MHIHNHARACGAQMRINARIYLYTHAHDHVRMHVFSAYVIWNRNDYMHVHVKVLRSHLASPPVLQIQMLQHACANQKR